jgi:hypothetical protein
VRPSIRPPAKTNWLTNGLRHCDCGIRLDEAQNSGSTEYSRRTGTEIRIAAIQEFKTRETSSRKPVPSTVAKE